MSKVIKILHLIETTGPGGAETVLLNIVRNLDGNRYKSIVGLFGGGWLYDNLQKHGIPVVFFERGGRMIGNLYIN